LRLYGVIIRWVRGSGWGRVGERLVAFCRRLENESAFWCLEDAVTAQRWFEEGIDSEVGAARVMEGPLNEGRRMACCCERPGPLTRAIAWNPWIESSDLPDYEI